MARQKCSAQMDGAKEKETPNKCRFTYTIQKKKEEEEEKQRS
jgi:hypothetical protein